jgi:Tol biopolymer transport system component
VSRASNGRPANSYSSNPAISANGRWVAFESLASNLAPVHRLFSRVYLRDRRTGTTKLISPVLRDATAASITRDGRLVAYTRNEGRARSSIGVYDRRTGRTARADVSSSEHPANGPSWSATLSRTGRFVAFASDADNLVPGDRNGGTDIFVRDRAEGTTQRVSIRPDGTPIGQCPQSPDPEEEPAPICSHEPAISGSGRYVVFSTELRRFDHAGAGGVFVRDRRSRRTRRISISPGGEPLSASLPAISGDGRAGTFAADFLYVRAPLH